MVSELKVLERDPDSRNGPIINGRSSTPTNRMHGNKDSSRVPTVSVPRARVYVAPASPVNGHRPDSSASSGFVTSMPSINAMMVGHNNNLRSDSPNAASNGTHIQMSTLSTTPNGASVAGVSISDMSARTRRDSHAAVTVGGSLSSRRVSSHHNHANHIINGNVNDGTASVKRHRTGSLVDPLDQTGPLPTNDLIAAVDPASMSLHHITTNEENSPLIIDKLLSHNLRSNASPSLGRDTIDNNGNVATMAVAATTDLTITINAAANGSISPIGIISPREVNNALILHHSMYRSRSASSPPTTPSASVPCHHTNGAIDNNGSSRVVDADTNALMTAASSINGASHNEGGDTRRTQTQTSPPHTDRSHSPPPSL
jgi:hypothetical protein